MNQDVPHGPHKKHSEWLIEQHRQQLEKLQLQQAIIAQYPNFDEAKELVKQLQNDVVYYENFIEYLKKNFNQQSDCNKSQDEADNEDNDLLENEDDKFVQNDSIQREPMDMLHPKYKGMSMFDIIERILNETSEELSSEEITRIAYDTRSEDEFNRAKASMSAQLRIGASKRRWVKRERGVFAATHVAQQLQTGGNTSTNIKPDTSHMENPLLFLSQIKNGKKID